MIKCWDKFLNTCYGDQAHSLCCLIGALVANPYPGKGRVYLIIGKAGSGKSSLLCLLQKMMEHRHLSHSIIEIIHDADPDKIESDPDKVIIAATNKEPKVMRPEFDIIRTTGDRLSKEQYRFIMETLNQMIPYIALDCEAAFVEDCTAHKHPLYLEVFK